ncbi:MAG: leucyl aminopeptidase [Chloroflexi bacterium]|nr:leucyl aminopeptidase [Chloroflexota bacterium]
MKIKVVSGDIVHLPVDAVIVNLFEGVERPGGATGAVDQALGGAISELIASVEIKGKLFEMGIVHTMGRIDPRRVIVAGLGKQSEFTLDRVRDVAAEACRAARRVGAKRVATIVHGAGIGGLEPQAACQAVVEGSILGSYTFRKHFTKEPERPDIEEFTVVERDASRLPALETGSRRGEVIAEATNWTRDLVNEPANLMTPGHMAQAAQDLARAHGLEITVLERQQMQELGMGALLGVAQGSHQPPKLIYLKYKGDEASSQTLGLLGKGITFDSGGISIKPAEGMGEMKGDMAGGATVIAALKAIAQLQPRVNVAAVVPATENLPGGGAIRPGDILKAMNGKTIEVVSTDAEGRMILADALCYARKQGLSPLVDVATLTGACQVALGSVYSGAFTNNRQWLEKVMRAAESAGERLWSLPMHEDYKEQNKSDVADIKNAGSRYGGAITAALFLAEFVDSTPWVHLDIAGTSRSEKDRGSTVKGATGVVVRTLVNLALAESKT